MHTRLYRAEVPNEQTWNLDDLFASEPEWEAELAAIEAESIGWLPPGDEAYLHVGDPEALVVTVVGVPDDKTGEAIKLVVVRKDPALTEEALRAFCAESLTGYKRPKYIEFRDALPKTPVGKILRRELRDK